MIRIFAIVLLAFATLAPITAAAQVVGTAIVDGRKVKLFQDKTWEFETAKNGDCLQLSAELSFCGDPTVWKKQVPPTNEILAQFSKDSKTYSQYIWEGLGSNDGMNSEFIREAILQNVTVLTGGSVDDVPVLGVFPADLNGKSGETLVYSVKFRGLDIVFANTAFVWDNASLQAMVYRVGTKSYTDEHRAVMAEFLSLTKVSK